MLVKLLRLLAVLASLCAGVWADEATCTSCHREIAESFAKSGMGRSFKTVRSGTTLPEFNGVAFQHKASLQAFTPYLNGGVPSIRRSGPGILESRIDYIFGSGNHARSYVHRTPNGKLVELPVTWYAEQGGHWGMSPAFDRPDHSGFSREITYRCMFCHNGYPDIPEGADLWDGGSTFPASLPQGIDCQRCHGSGAAHIASGAPIYNPKQQMEVCLQCHLETTSGQLPPAVLRPGRGVFSYRPGEPLGDYMTHFDHAPGKGHDDRFELVSSAYRLRKSRCFLESGGALTCVTCHDPHTGSRDYTKVCLSCHAPKMARSHPAASECTSCHMPKRRPSDAIHIVITDHLIGSKPAPPDPSVEQHDGNMPRYTGPVVPYYPATADELTSAVAQAKHGSPVRLETAVVEQRPTQSETYFDLAEAWSREGRPDKALPWYREAVKRDPQRWYYWLGFGVAAGSREHLLRAASLAPAETTPLLALGDAASLRKAILLNPESAEAHNNLGNLLLRQGGLKAAVEQFGEAVRLRPEVAAIQNNLGSAQAAQGETTAAVGHFRRAVELAPDSDLFTLNLGLALADAGDHTEAKKYLRKAAQSRDPQIRTTATEALR